MSLCPKRLVDTDSTPPDANRQVPVCVGEACFQQPVGWGCLVSSANRCATCDLSPPPAPAVCSLAFSLPRSPPYPLCNFYLICCFSAFASYLYAWQHSSHGPLPGFSLRHPLSPVHNSSCIPPLRFPRVPFCPPCLYQLCFSP